ncbi:alpha/beta hydrolase [Nocardia puris]|uniref:alpha/beta hydrolase n=1 Tax=Nocardia puris TaxID=208602 RepID=UPI001893B0FD|nr:alpha/beta hydrolase [Nocardia puris]MBF6216310.1 alpha/beta hydrolase [Nocardia puris]
MNHDHTTPTPVRVIELADTASRRPPDVTLVYTCVAGGAPLPWTGVARRVQRIGGVRQLALDRRIDASVMNADPARTGHALAADLDAALAHAFGAVVLVTHCLGGALAAAWAEHHPRRAAMLDGHVMVNVPAAPDPALVGEGLLTTLRAVPTVLVTGSQDPIADPASCHQWAEHLWAEADLVPGGGHMLPMTHPDEVAASITHVIAIARAARAHAADLGEIPGVEL